jgi:hypothetical protein
MRLFFVVLYSGLMLVWLSGCAGPKPFQGGPARHVSATGSRTDMCQPQNPKEAATQKAQGAIAEQKTFPAGAIFRETKTTVEAGKTNTVATELTVPTNTPVPAVFTSKLNDSSETRVGGAFADSASELAERVKSIRPVMFFGLAMLAAAVALAYFGWWTKAGIAAGIGVASIALASPAWQRNQDHPRRPWRLCSARAAGPLCLSQGQARPGPRRHSRFPAKPQTPTNTMITIATFDIETSHLCADFGVILCAAVKPHIKGAKPEVFRGDELNPDWDTKRSNDKPVVRSLLDALNDYDVLIAHNGLKFDLPFIRTRLAKWNLKPLPE